MIVWAKAPSAPLGGSPVVLAEQGALEPLNLQGPINGNNCFQKKNSLRFNSLEIRRWKGFAFNVNISIISIILYHFPPAEASQSLYDYIMRYIRLNVWVYELGMT